MTAGRAPAHPPRVLIPGGSGVFGRLLAAEVLQHTDAEVVIAARNLARARGVCRSLGPRASALELDLREAGALARAARGIFAVACAAGPFSGLDRRCVSEAVGAGAHWVDISDDPGWVVGVVDDAALRARASAARVSVLTGQSSVPAISGALVRAAARRLPGAERACVTLAIGNRNPKGTAAIGAALAGGFRDPEDVTLPIGRRRAYLAASPDATLLSRIGLDAGFRVVLGLPGAGLVVSALGRTTAALPRARPVLARALAVAARPMSLFGNELGMVAAQVWDRTGDTAGVAVVGPQRLAVLPAAIAIERALEGGLAPGVAEPASWMTPDEWLSQLRARGVRTFRLRASGSNRNGPTHPEQTGD